MTNILSEVTAYRSDGTHNTYVFTDEDDYQDCLKLRFKLQKDESVVYISDVTCVEWFRDEIN